MLMSTHESRLNALREELKRQGLDGFVVPISDEHMSEYVGAYAQRLQWLTGFDGSAGTAAILTDAMRDPAAAMFIDGRYTLQVRDQVDGKLYAYESVPETSVTKWLGKHTWEGAKIGYDPWLHGKQWVSATTEALAAHNAGLVPTEANPIDAIWDDRPAPSPAAALVHGMALAGESSEAKRAVVADWLEEKGLDAVIIPALDSIAWLLNIRGSDVERTPVALSFAIAHAGGAVDLFIAGSKVTPELRAHLGSAVRIEERERFLPALEALAEKKVALDPDSCVQAIFSALDDAGAQIVEERDPCKLPKAIKNPVERQGHRDAQARDGAAMAHFLHWLSLKAPKGNITELAASDKVNEYRSLCGDLRDLSFDTISGSGPNGAIVHYRVTEETSRTLEPGSVYLVDSGGQYPNGTTDITRTVWIGPDAPPTEVKDRFTRVLKGNIALSRASFPKGTRGSQLDILARQFLWDAGLDYAHGTGHGVGSFLSVHEGPQRIAKTSGAQTGGEQELMPGMIVSDEPGYYKAGEYGIRIEHLLLVEERAIDGAEDQFYGFEVLTLVPMDRTLVEPGLLTPAEIDWWNTYHFRVLETVGPHVDGAVLDWLKAQCTRL
jgi:Xaa-Pro aminopeptidase